MKARSFVLVCFLPWVLFSGIASSACLKTPAPSGVVTSLYGWRFHPVLKQWRLHRGIDLRADMMTPLAATHNGVAQVAYSPSGGNELRIVGADGTVSRYLHLSRVSVDPGAKVSAGQPVAISGNTGHASAGPHLHLEVYPRGAKGDVNPEPLLCPNPSRKAGAEQTNGFPIVACKPDEGSACTPGGGSLLLAGASAVASPTATQPGPKPGEFDDMSTMELITSEVMKRFANPDWYAKLQERTKVPLTAEYLHMLALEDSIALEKREALTRIEALLAVRLARANKKEIDARQARQRESAAKSSGNRYPP